MKKRGLIILMALFCLMGFFRVSQAEIYWTAEVPESWSDKELMRITVFPTISNDAALLEVGGKSMLIDGGMKGQYKFMQPALEALGYGEHIDILYNTHPHDDHIGCQTQLVRYGLKADEFISTFPEELKDEQQERMVSYLHSAGIPYRQIENGEIMYFGGAVIEFRYWPEGRDLNALSSLAKINFGETGILYTADATSGTQLYFHENAPEWLRSDLLKFPHHALNIAKPEFLNDIAPKFTYITSYKWATPEVNRQLEYREIPYMHTSVGTIILETDGTDWYIWQTKDPFLNDK